MFIFLRHNIQNNTNKQVVYNYYRDTALQYMTYDILKEYLFNIVSYKGVRAPQAEDKCSWGFAPVHCCMQDRADYGHMTMFSLGSLSGQVLCTVHYCISYFIK
jgi:Iap family predicted aminopeptidase